MESGQLPDSQKQTFLRALELLCDPWLKQNLTTMHPNVYKYVYQVLKMAYDVLPSTEQHPRPKLKIRLPTLAAIPSIEEEKEPEPVPVVVVEKPQKPKQPTPKKKVKLEPEFERCRKALQKIMNLKSAFWFLQPVDHVGMGLVNYLDVIKEPMDLGTIMTQLEAGEIQSVQEFSRLVRLVFENAIKYNPELSQVTVDAKQLLFRFDSEFSSELATMDDETKEMCLDVLQKLFASEHSAIFRAPVDPQLYATYYKVIKDPMDLTTCKQRLESGQYPTLQHFHQDIRKIINNCYKFNKKGTYGYAAGRSFENYYNQIRKVLALMIGRQR
ncbi:Bromodomain-containing protein [Gorgonomyces haynaldii]|nr:Bromodomain-containing protein [Gorgonomyces haynaldii]